MKTSIAFVLFAVFGLAMVSAQPVSTTTSQPSSTTVKIPKLTLPLQDGIKPPVPEPQNIAEANPKPTSPKNEEFKPSVPSVSNPYPQKLTPGEFGAAKISIEASVPNLPNYPSEKHSSSSNHQTKSSGQQPPNTGSVKPLILTSPLKKEELKPNSQDFKNGREEELGLRFKRVTCDLLSVSTKLGSLNDSACAAHCLAMRKGFKGGHCKDGVCHCRK